LTSKKCPKCGQVKPLTEYNNHKNRPDGVQFNCRDCQGAYAKANPRKEYARAWQEQRRTENRERFSQWLEDNHCIDCGESDIVVLELDHIDPDTKDKAIADLMKNSFSWERIKAEIDKCVVRCANCHRRKTAKQFNWYKTKRTHKSSGQ
jgi:hypothetical protein